MRKPVQLALIGITVSLWIALALLINRQRHLMEEADPLADTGISFGYVFLPQFAGPGLLILTAVVVCILTLLESRSKNYAKTKAQLPK